MNTLLRLLYRFLLIPFIIGSVIERIGRISVKSVLSVISTLYKSIRALYAYAARVIVSTVGTLQKSLKKGQRRLNRSYKKLYKRWILFRVYIRGQSIYFKVAMAA